jgi:putative tricarboxylic transport membrane protein
MKGVQMGPMLLQRQPEYMGSVFVSMMFTNIVMVFVSFAVAKVFGKVLSIPYSILGTLILLLATIGSYALQNNTGNVILMVIAGIFGYAYSKFGFNIPALILGLVLGPIVETNLRRAIMLEQGNVLAVFTKPITAVLIIVSIASLLLPIVKPLIDKKKVNATN